MKITTTLAVAIGVAALSACNQAQEPAAENFDANAVMPAENLDMPADNMATDTNLGNDANVTDDTDANNTAGNTY